MLQRLNITFINPLNRIIMKLKINENAKDFLFSLIWSLIVVGVVYMLLSCRTSRSCVRDSTDRSDTLTHVTHDSDTSYTHINSVDADSHFNQERIDSLRQVYEHTDSMLSRWTDHFERVSDSVAVHVDSLGQLTWHHYHIQYEKHTVHDTLRVATRSREQEIIIHTLRDSILIYREHIRRIEKQSEHFDSIYNAIYENKLNNSVTEKQPTIMQKASQHAVEIIMVILVISAISLVAKKSVK